MYAILFYWHGKMKFFIYDLDNDPKQQENCAVSTAHGGAMRTRMVSLTASVSLVAMWQLHRPYQLADLALFLSFLEDG
ncbi:unnamed protein product [Clavelina lepadiformis]|uniref:Uncharacterized protein n=1 Tax=Clavelina lepadiformis TaxID=159417 RepID=A0ABP0FJP8_CLALP